MNTICNSMNYYFEGTKALITSLHDQQIPFETDSTTGLPVGPKVERASAAGLPGGVLEGRFCRLEPLNAKAHAQELFEACHFDDAPARFRYLPDTAPQSVSEFTDWVEEVSQSEDPLFYAVIDKRSDRVEGRQTFLNINPAQQSIEIGHIFWGPNISQTPVTTEANFLFAQHAFNLGYRRYEWKCDALNAPSRSAALRFGFTFEGHFRRAVINRGRTRDTTWFSIIEDEWPQLEAAYQQWLEPSNFDNTDKQIKRLAELITTHRG